MTSEPHTHRGSLGEGDVGVPYGTPEEGKR